MMRTVSLYFFIISGALFAKIGLANNSKNPNIPIDSLCIYEAKPGQLVPLAHCGLSVANPKRTIIESDSVLPDQGYIGYSYQNKTASGQPLPPPGYSYYRVIGQIGHEQIVQTVNNAGGNGAFTGLYRIAKPDPKHIIVYPIAVGDRCNGGIVQAKIQHAVLEFQQNITGYALFSLMPKNISHAQSIAPYTDLSDCAVCCIAKAVYQIKPGAWEHKQLQHVILSKDLAQHTDSNQGQYQNCFNSILVSQQRPDTHNIYPEKFSKIIPLFEKQCIPLRNHP